MLPQKHSIKFTQELYDHFNATVYIIYAILAGELGNDVKEHMKKKAVLSDFLNAWKKIDPTDTIDNEEKAIDTEIIFTEDELLCYLLLSDFILKLILSSRFTRLNEHILKMAGDGFDYWSQAYIHDTALLLRLACIRLKNSSSFYRQLKQGIDYAL